MRDIRGNDISMIFQEPMTSLNPVLTIGRQITETLTLHQGLDRRAAEARAIEMLRLVGIPEPAQRIRQYPHELSGGMRQRVMIAMALACDPKLLIADEPTTALDVTVQAQILDLMRQLKAKTGAAIILITHSLGLVAEMAQRVVVMYGGRKVEEAPVDALVRQAAPSLHAGAARLRAAARAPRLAGNGTGPAGGDPRRRPIAQGGHRRLHLRAALPACHRALPGGLSAAGGKERRPLGRLLGVRPPHGGGVMSASSGPGGEGPQEAFPVRRGMLSGCRPQGLCGRWHLVLHQARRDAGAGGRVRLRQVHRRQADPQADRADGRRNPARRRAHRRALPRATCVRTASDLQVVFQDPYSSLNPRMRAKDIVAEPMQNFARGSKAEIEAEVATLFEKVGLRRDQMIRFPHEFSGGQRQRLVIARALALRPKLIVCDEAVSALDVSVQAQVINLLADLQRDFGVAYLFIAHDLAVVEHISHRVAVMYLGRIVELADKRRLFASPQHPYTEALLSAVPVPDPNAKSKRIILQGDVPSPIRPPPGCHFHTRCPYAEQRCRVETPLMREVAPGHLAACHLRPGPPV